MIEDPLSGATQEVYEEVDPDLEVSSEDLRAAAESGWAEGSLASRPPVWFSFRRKWELQLWAANRADALRTLAAHQPGHCAVYPATGIGYSGFYVYFRRDDWSDPNESGPADQRAGKSRAGAPNASLLGRARRFMAGD
jgi:hypothetical protein